MHPDRPPQRRLLRYPPRMPANPTCRTRGSESSTPPFGPLAARSDRPCARRHGHGVVRPRLLHPLARKWPWRATQPRCRSGRTAGRCSGPWWRRPRSPRPLTRPWGCRAPPPGTRQGGSSERNSSRACVGRAFRRRCRVHVVHDAAGDAHRARSQIVAGAVGTPGVQPDADHVARQVAEVAPRFEGLFPTVATRLVDPGDERTLSPGR